MRDRILIVDDDEELTDELSEILRDENYNVSAAYDGLKAKEALDKNNYDLILLDLKLPSISGYELLKLIKGKEGAPKVIVISGSPSAKKNTENEPDDPESSTLSLADELFNKPFDTEELLKSISRLLAS